MWHMTDNAHFWTAVCTGYWSLTVAVAAAAAAIVDAAAAEAAADVADTAATDAAAAAENARKCRDDILATPSIEKLNWQFPKMLLKYSE